jgi:hypothetical protein
MMQITFGGLEGGGGRWPGGSLWEVMKLPTPADDLATFLATVYCTVDELYVERFGPQKPVRPGAPPEASDSEVLTLLVLAHWQSERSEAAFVAYVGTHWGCYFPRGPSQSAYNRRTRDLAPVVAALGPAVAERVVAGWPGAHCEAVDGVPVPLARRCRGAKRRLFAADQAALGKGGSDKDWYFGVRLGAAVHPSGVVTGFVSAPADTGERWLLEALLRWRTDPLAPQPAAADVAALLGPTHRKGGTRKGPTGLVWGRTAAGCPARGPYVADLGFRGHAWQQHWHRAYRAPVLTKADRPADATPAQQRALRHTACAVRQQVETAFGWLETRCHLAFPRARTMAGLLARLGAKIAAHNLTVYLNTLLQRPPFAALSPYDL